MSFEFSTMEAGGGSYPEPPDMPEPEVLECEECYETEGLKEIDGHLLCRHCRADYIFQNTDHSDRMRFIKDNYDDQVGFFIRWFFEGLSDLEKLYIIKPHFDRFVDQSEKEFQVSTYVAELKGEFADFMERTVRRRGF